MANCGTSKVPSIPACSPSSATQINQTPRDGSIAAASPHAMPWWPTAARQGLRAGLDKPLPEQILKDLDAGKIVFEPYPRAPFQLHAAPQRLFRRSALRRQQAHGELENGEFSGAPVPISRRTDQPNVKHARTAPCPFPVKKGGDMAIKRDKVDMVLVGFSGAGPALWHGAGSLPTPSLGMLALERGGMRDTPTDAISEGRRRTGGYSIRGQLYQELSKKPSPSATA